MNPAFLRIALRYLAGYLVLKGIVPEDVADMIAHDPELTAAIGVAIGAAVEGAYGLAKKLGWRT
jgi:hypothetical protein